MSYSELQPENGDEKSRCRLIRKGMEAIPLFELASQNGTGVTGRWSFAERFIGWSSLYLFLEMYFLLMLVGCLLVSPHPLFVDIISYWLIPTLALMAIITAAVTCLKVTSITQIHKWSKGIYKIIVIVCMAVSICGSVVLSGGTFILLIMHYISPWTLWENGVNWGWEFAYSILIVPFVFLIVACSPSKSDNNMMFPVQRPFALKLSLIVCVESCSKKYFFA